MYVVTFYSFKGGVGRTMALVNTAVALARMGRRVLVVDFDLEAPGLPSYQVFRDTECGLGVVDYVNSYRATGVAPNATEYISVCDVSGVKLWLMPAGRHTKPGYTEALNSIDWNDLYEYQNGYLMFEDLKQQWEQYNGQGFDYVLIDSRTGHTDVGGICTRQLPDAAVIMFVPNEQNILGLVPIVDAIRSEEKARKKKIELHFCPSNVPDLDDEKDILKNLLDSASKKLKYKPDSAPVIHHYSSLEILAQPAFVISRPNTSLAKEYEKLRMAIISMNYSDREGAVVALQKMPAEFERARNSRSAESRDQLRANAIDIRALHPKDGEIAYLAARVFNEIGEKTEEFDALTSAIELGYEVSRSRLGRSVLQFMSRHRDEALGDLKEILSHPAATAFELKPALQLLQKADSRWMDILDTALDRPNSDFKTIIGLSQFILQFRDALPILARRMEKFINSQELPENDIQLARNTATLSLIGSGAYQDAMSLLAANGDLPRASSSVDVLFNYAIADWGANKVASRTLFEDVATQIASYPAIAGANGHQCFALVFAVLGLVDQARRELSIARKIVTSGEVVFSCWRYLNVTGKEMIEDLKAMDAALEGGETLEPAFFREVTPVLH